ncbi:MAG: lipase family protein [Bacteroidales bacterium]|nr:lipase family protein [Bacteroidales bacterium]
MRTTRTLSMILAAIIVWSCDLIDPSRPDSSIPETFPLESSALNGTMGKAQLEAVCPSSVKDLLTNDIELYKIIYRTTYQKDTLKSEALVAVPAGMDEVKLCAYFHGAVLPISFIPMNNFSGYKGGPTISKDIASCILPLASHGYCVVVPEYIGYGITSKKDHPFIYYPELNIDCLDAIRAARKFLETKDIHYSNDILLTGWSEGAGEALYAHRDMEQNHPDEFNVIATSSLAGPYSIYHMMMNIFAHPDKEYGSLMLYSWAGYALNKFAPTLNRPSTELFTSATNTQSSALRHITGTPASTFNQDFMTGILEGTDTEFIKVMEECSTYEGWTPKGYVFLHHGTADSTVPCFNSEDAYESFKDTGKAKIYLYKFGEHDTSLNKYISTTIEDFESL